MTSHDAPTAPRRLLVGVDGSSHSIAALRRAAAIGADTGATLRVLTCWTYPGLAVAVGAVPIDLLEQSARTQQRDALRAVFGRDLPAGIETVLAQGLPARVLVEGSEHADLVVVGSRGHGGFAGLLLGSVSMTCAEHARCDVLVVRS